MAVELVEQGLYVGLDVPRGKQGLCPSVPCLNGSGEGRIQLFGVLDVADTGLKGGKRVDGFG